jgi:DNA replication protein DnaC
MSVSPYRINDGDMLPVPPDWEGRPCGNECGATLTIPRSTWQMLDRQEGGRASRWCDDCCKAQERAEREAKRLSAIPASFHWAKLDAPELAQRVPAACIQRAHNALTTGVIGRVVLVGPAGCGKTSLGCAMIRDRLDAKRDVHVGLAWRLAGARARHPLGVAEAPEVERAIGTGLLLLDDMGSERNVPSNAVPDVVFERHAEGRPTWVTTWMTPEQMATRYGDGIARRVFEGAVVIDCGAAISEGKRGG